MPNIFTRESAPSLRWGVIGSGHIASAFVTATMRFTNQCFVAVGSRSLERAEAFASQLGLPCAVGSYEDLVTRKDIDVVYVAAPQSEHLRLGLLAITAGKHVLIEKPLAMTEAEGRALTDAARDAGVFLMEAMWTRYLPQSDVIRRLVRDGVLGDLELVIADHGQAISRDGTSRLWKRELGGGAIGDIGIYPIALSSEMLGEPEEIVARGGVTSTGVDSHATMILNHPNGAQASLTASMLTSTPIRATIAGEDARIDIGQPFFTPASFTLSGPLVYGGERIEWKDPTGLSMYDGLSWEATALAKFVGEGRRESPLHNHTETLSILATIDEARRQVLSHSGANETAR
ncbi:Gfo/Idh/MocA family oxidoreductase [Pseudarthrobacter sp. R1]|nr:Gfo/Idh/MocA family oxidoreductase [Pseudarthrobacter sp. R1]